MIWRLVGAGFGYWSLGPFGGVLGFFIGYMLDNARIVRRHTRVNMNQFCKQTFAIMGHVAKADGRVSEHEISFAETLMRELGLNNNIMQRRLMQEQFLFGKSDAFNLNQELIKMRAICQQAPYMYEVFMEVLIKVALADGDISAAELNILHHIREQVGLSLDDFLRIEDRCRVEAANDGNLNQTDITFAYQTLGLSEDASMKEIKRTYRRLVSASHPDKLSAKDTSPEELKAANDKTRSINKAYETLKRHLGNTSS